MLCLTMILSVLALSHIDSHKAIDHQKILIQKYKVLINQASTQQPSGIDSSIMDIKEEVDAILKFVDYPIPVLETLEKLKVDGLFIQELSYRRDRREISANIISADSSLLSQYVEYLENSDTFTSVRLVKKVMTKNGQTNYVIEASY